MRLFSGAVVGPVVGEAADGWGRVGCVSADRTPAVVFPEAEVVRRGIWQPARQSMIPAHIANPR